MKRAFPVLLASVLAFLGLQALVFHTGVYAYWVSPSSSAGYLQTVLHNENIRPKNHANQVAAVGDSRMALVPKTANALTPETGYTFGTVAAAGATPRVWYYILRAADPQANRYRAIVITLESYNDDDGYEDLSARESDLNYVLPYLTWKDLPEFSHSFPDQTLQWRAARGIAFKGSVYQRDFQDFLQHPLKRIEEVKLSWKDSHLWFYDFRTDDASIAPLTVDWETRQITFAPDTAPDRQAALRQRLVEPLAPQTGRHSRYMRYWLGRIYEHYRGSQTRLIFLRVPRGPWIRPDFPPTNPNSSVHELEKQPNVTLLPEHLFDELERPEIFHDEVHMNQIGLDRFSQILAREMPKVLGPAR